MSGIINVCLATIHGEQLSAFGNKMCEISLVLLSGFISTCGTNICCLPDIVFACFIQIIKLSFSIRKDKPTNKYVF